MVAISKLANNVSSNGPAAPTRGGNGFAAGDQTQSSQPSMALQGKTAAETNKNASPSASSTGSGPAVALTASGKPKEKRRNNEKRKERSRDAARCRRSRETEIFTELANVLPMQKEDVQQLDKASVMRIAIAYLKVRDMLKMFPKIQELYGDLPAACIDIEKETDSLSSSEDTLDSLPSQPSPQSPNEVAASRDITAEENTDKPYESAWLLKQTLDGFLLILSNDGDITYVTDNICDFLGISKIDILGQQIWEYAHQCDHAELKEALNIKRHGLSEKIKDEQLAEEGITTHHRDLFVRLKCTLTSRGRSINIKSASYKVIHITGHLVVNAKGDRVLVAMGRPIPHPSNIEVPLGSTTFLTKHSLDMKFLYADDKMFNLLGYQPEDLMETSLFNYHHGIDSDSLMATFKNVLTKGQGETARYRFLGKFGGYCWLVTQATIVYDKLKPQSVVCVNYVISNLEKKHEIYTLQQYEAVQKLKLEDKNAGHPSAAPLDNEAKEQQQQKVAEQIAAAAAANTTNFGAEIKEPKVEPQPQPLAKVPNAQSAVEVNEKIAVTSAVQIKREQTPPIVVEADGSESRISSAPAAAPVIAAQPVQPQQTSALPHCPTTTVTRNIFVNKTATAATIARSNLDNAAVPLTPLAGAKFSDDKRPKTVTSSILRPAPNLTYAGSLPTTTSTQSILQPLQPLNVSTAAQSVTASLFAQRSQQLPSTTATAAILAKQPPPPPPPQQQQTVAAASICNAAPPAQQQQAAGANNQDMNKGYLTFAEDATELTMLKEEPDDLTAHLVAPNSVDACLPLDETTPLFNEMLVGLIGSYSSLLPEDINSLDSSASSTSSTEHSHAQSPSSHSHNSSSGSLAAYNALTSATQHNHSSNNNNNNSSSNRQSCSPAAVRSATSAAASVSLGNNSNSSNNSPLCNNAANGSSNIDPFIHNSHDESNDTLCSQHLLSPPSVTSKSPEGSSLPSLCSPNSLSQEEEFYYTMNVDDMDDLTMRAPYIPMNEQDDLPLLTTDDFMWSSGNAFTADDFTLHAKDADNLQALQINPSLSYHSNQPQQQQQTAQHQQPFAQQQQFSSSLCSSPASTVSSMSPSPLEQQQQQQQQSSAQQLLAGESSELAALLCGSVNGPLSSLLQDTNGLACGSNSNSEGMLTDELDNSSSPQQQQQFQQQCLQQLQEQLQQHQRQQQQQQLLGGLNISCKKEKFDTNNSTPLSSLCDSIEDSFDSVYNKNSTNLDCWNDFLQINSNADNSNNGAAATAQTQQLATTVIALENLRAEDCKQQLQMQLQQQQPQQQQQQQNIILNAVPLITIQSNNKNLLQQSPNGQTPSNAKLMNKVNTIKLTPITSTATIRIIENKQPLQQQQQQNIVKTTYIQTGSGNGNGNGNGVTMAQGSGNKRQLNGASQLMSSMESKRLKGNNSMDMQNNSQLLQQLTTTSKGGQQQQQQANVNAKETKSSLGARWSANNSNNNNTNGDNKSLSNNKLGNQQQQQSQSNSVLKNLLISGCDSNNLVEDDALLATDGGISLERCISPSLTRPLRCMTLSPTPASSGDEVLLNQHNNPLIGGPGVLPSPILISDDSNPPGLMPCDQGSDSGIDDGATENMSPLKRCHESQDAQLYGGSCPTKCCKFENIEAGLLLNDLVKLNNAKGFGNAAVMAAPMLEADEDEGATISKRKRSISFMDSSNPLMTTPLLMDLCNDDYNMNTKEFLEESYIENVLNAWPSELV